MAGKNVYDPVLGELRKQDFTEADIKKIAESVIGTPVQEVISVATYADLEAIENPSAEAIYIVTSNNNLYRYNGSGFIAITGEVIDNTIYVSSLNALLSMTLDNASVYRVLHATQNINTYDLTLGNYLPGHSAGGWQAQQVQKYYATPLTYNEALNLLTYCTDANPIHLYGVPEGIKNTMAGIHSIAIDDTYVGEYTFESYSLSVNQTGDKTLVGRKGWATVANDRWAWENYAMEEALQQVIDNMTGKQDKTDNSLLTTVKTIVGAINELWNKFADYALANHNHDGVYQPAGSYAASDHTHSQYLTQHQDISGKQDKTDNSLLTTVKTIVGAINELWNKFADYLKGIQHVTYAQLVTLRDNSKLVAGQWYRITDYMTTVANDTEARSAGHPFDLLVMATNCNTLSEEAKAVKSSRDSNGYFTDANLNAWKVWYSLDNDTTRFQWADTENGKGVIWRIIDEWQNDCPYDFKNVQFKRYRATALNELIEDAIDGQYYAYNGDMMNVEIEDEDDFVWAYTFTLIDENEEWVDYSIKKEGSLDPETDWGYLNQFKKGRCEYNLIRHSYTAVTIDDECYRTLMLNNIVLISTINEECGLSGEMQLNEFGTGNYNMTVKDNPEKNVFGNKCYNNIVGSYGNTFGNGCGGNTFGNSFQYNTFGNYCYNNTFGNNCGYNTFGNYCYNNTFGNGCSWNTFGNYFRYNTFGNDCYNNTFGNDCSWNTFGNNCRYITVHNGVRYVAVPGGSTDSAYVQNAQILNGTHGSDSSNRLQISFQEDADYCQYAGLNSSGNLRIWTPADSV